MGPKASCSYHCYPGAEERSNGKSKKTPTDAKSSASVIGVWGSASRQKVKMYDTAGSVGPWVQVSRLAILVHELIVPLGKKGLWNKHIQRMTPVANLLYIQNCRSDTRALPGRIPTPATLNASKAARADLPLFCSTGLPSGIIPGFPNYTGTTQAVFYA